MGNAQSASSARHASTPLKPGVNGSSPVAIPDSLDATACVQAPGEKEENNVLRRRLERRRSLMKFSSLRRRPRSVAGPKGEDLSSTDGPINPSPSRRRWRAFSGFKNHPPKTTASARNEDSLPEASRSSIQEQASNNKGKERETPQESVEPDEPTAAASDLIPSVPGPSHSGVMNLNEHEQPSPPDEMFRELRELQDTSSVGNNHQPTEPHILQVEGSGSQVERPPTPVPTPAIKSTHDSEGIEVDSGARSHTALAEALGSWMGGRSRGENPELVPSNDPVSSESHSQNVDMPAVQRNSNAVSVDHNHSDLFGALPGNTGRPSGASAPMPPLAVPPVRPESGSRFGQHPVSRPMQQDRRTLPPAGTGTLVVVQGVVHTTDVRHNVHSSRSHTPSASTRPPRSVSSTPTLRAASRPSISRPPSRASTPQPPSSPRRTRFSSLTSNLRARSRPGTSSSHRSGTASCAYGLSGLNNLDSGETASERSDVLGFNSSASDSEITTASTPSMDTSVPQDDASVRESSRHVSQSEVIDDIDGIPLRDQSRTQAEGEETQPADGRRNDHAPGADVDGSDEENETELSASSIEVLGTLLSVATAATAASLVTGTTDPLFSSGLTGSNANVARRDAASPTPGNPSADPTSPLAQETEASRSSESPNSNNAEAVVNTRMRAAWESLRDRFSRTRRRSTVAGGSGTDGREDPREQMLREMARAFNTGLGLDPDDDSEERREGVAAPDESSQHEASSSERDGRIAPEAGNLGPGSEGSFERFLHNLQVDLRTALTEDYAARRARAQGRDARPATFPLSTAPAQISTTSTDALSAVLPEPITSSERPENPILSLHGGVDAGTEPSVSPLLSTVPNTPRPATLDLPSLPGDRETSPDSSGVGHVPAQAHGITGQPGAGINWWRLYRFPPMQLAPHPSTSAAGGVPAQNGPSASEDPATPQSGVTGSHLRTPELPADREVPNNQNVVPVIVVGLQSVVMNQDGAHHHNHHRQPDHDSPSPLDTHFPNGESGSLPDSPARERAWPLRAASRAFGRRSRRSEADPSADDDAPSVDPTSPREGRQGGRTYLIFVIGGYYPPNHSIVTGADDMNSFEALWELAELLGQVKPPVASKEDIEKSGLEIIKASRLAEYEQRGKVASNTVERCLICLDDYEHEDDLRLLSCRHIFHKQCVDKWLEHGRNNCPACRTRGVRTGDESPPPEPTSSSRD